MMLTLINSVDEDDSGVWEITKTKDQGNCETAAKALGGAVLKGYNRDITKFKDKAIKEGDLGVIYETNLTTKGAKYSLFFKYTRDSKDKRPKKAEMVLIAIACHKDASNKYYECDKKGKPTKKKISATKKL